MSTGYILKYVLQGAPITLEIAAGAWVLGSVLGLLLALVRHPGGILGFSAASVITVLRCVPPLVLLYVVFFGLTADGVAIPAVPAAAAALGLVEASFTAEYFRAGFLTVQSGQYDAAHSLGLSRFSAFRLVIVPQAFIFAVPPLLNSFVALLKLATIASAVGAPEVLYRGQLVYEQSGQITTVVVVIILIYLLVTIPLTKAISMLEAKLQLAMR